MSQAAGQLLISTRTYKSTLQFLPRPLLLRLHAEARRTNDPDLMATINQGLQLTFIMDQPSLCPDNNQTHEKLKEHQSDFWTNPSSHCDDSFSYKHDLQCGHIVLTSTAWPSINIVKEACGPNCNRYEILHLSGLPMDAFSGISKVTLCCPVCIEQNVRKRYDRIHAEYSIMGWTPSENKETNIKIWTHRLGLRCVASGMRMCQGVDGVFGMEGCERYEELKQELFAGLNSTKSVTHGRAWDIRNEDGRSRGRSGSPGSEDEYDVFDFRTKRISNYRERSPARQR